MSDIRRYIDLVNEAFINPYAGNRPAFGRKNTDIPVIRPTDPEDVQDLERCKQYRTAEDYAKANNPYLPVYNHDPVSIRQRAQGESDRLMAQWNHWKQMGLL